MIVALKLTLALAAASLAASLATPLMIVPRADGRGNQVAIPDLVELRPGSFAHRAAGDFSRNGKPANAPIAKVRIDHPISISAGDGGRLSALRQRPSLRLHGG
jgi:hypothetical protein